tara:strand:+ start:574 stop:2055 length:1482 start_codon:yes stop_codon:yes gene_type:complete
MDPVYSIDIDPWLEFESLLKDPNHRNISDSSYITYKRNLDLLFAESVFSPKLQEMPSIQEKCYYIAEHLFKTNHFDTTLLDHFGWSNSTKKARIAALLIGIDPSGKEEDLEGYDFIVLDTDKKNNQTTKTDFHNYKIFAINAGKAGWQSKYFHNSANDVPISARTGRTYLKTHKYNFPKKAMLIHSLRKVCEESQKIYKKKVSEMNVKESANWVDFKHLEKRAAATRKKYNDKKPDYACDDQSMPDWTMPVVTALTDAIVATVYTRFPPRRLDWSKLEFFVDPTDYLGLSQELKDKTVAFYNNTIIFGKNAGKSQQQDDYVITKKEIGSVLLKLLRTQEKLVRCYHGKALELHKEGVYMMRTIPLKRGGRMTENSLGKRITRIFTFKNKTKKANLGLKVKKKKANGEEKEQNTILESDSGISRIRKCSAGMLRKIYISEKFAGDRILKSKIALAMNHSVRIQQAIYNKKGMEMTSNDIIQFEINQHHLDPFLS